MKLVKKVSAAVMAAALAATMAISASAASYKDVVTAAKNNGVPDNNIQELDYFLSANQAAFSATEFDNMIKDIEAVGKDIIAKHIDLAEIATYSAEQKRAFYRDELTEDERLAIVKACESAGDKYGVKITATKQADKSYKVSATLKAADKGKDATKVVTEAGKTTNPSTGDVNSVNSVAAIMSAIAIALAGTGIVVVAKKNREN